MVFTLLKVSLPGSIANLESLVSEVIAAVAPWWVLIVAVLVVKLLVGSPKRRRSEKRALQKRTPTRRPMGARRNALQHLPREKSARERARELKGEEGELAVQSALMQNLPYEDYQTVNNVLIPNGKGGLTQIDHVVVSSFGIFVVETKNWAGWVFGAGKDKNWTVTFRDGGKSQFRNPVRQNHRHIEALSELLKLPQTDFCNLVCFVGSAKLKSGPVSEVLHGDPAEHISSFGYPKFAAEKVREILWKLLLSTQSGNPSAVAAHRKQVERSAA